MRMCSACSVSRSSLTRLQAFYAGGVQWEKAINIASREQTVLQGVCEKYQNQRRTTYMNGSTTVLPFCRDICLSMLKYARINQI